MGHGQNPNRIIPGEIRNVISENFQVDSAVSFGAEPGNFRIVSNPANYRANIFFQPDAQTGFDFFVVSNGFGQFLLRFVKDFDLLPGKRWSSRANT